MIRVATEQNPALRISLAFRDGEGRANDDGTSTAPPPAFPESE